MPPVQQWREASGPAGFAHLFFAFLAPNTFMRPIRRSGMNKTQTSAAMRKVS